MNRKEFMACLEDLLQNVPVEERESAILYYNDYFDDAGHEREADVILELGSPEKVAASIRENMNGQSEDMARYTEHGYESGPEEKINMPMRRVVPQGESNHRADSWDEASYKNADGTSYHSTDYREEESPEGPRTLNKGLIIALVVIGSIIALPVVFAFSSGLIGVVFGVVFAAIGIFLGFVIGAVTIFIVGVVLFIVGLTQIAVLIPNALALCGSGLMLMALGAAGTVGAVKLCFIVYPAMFKGVVNVGRRIIHGEGAA